LFYFALFYFALFYFALFYFALFPSSFSSAKTGKLKVSQDFISLEKWFLSDQRMFHGTVLFYRLHA
jgi:hypothetical protein